MATAEDAGFKNWERVSGHISSNDKLFRCSAPNYAGHDSDQKLTDESIAFLKAEKIEHIISLSSKAKDTTISDALTNNGIAYTPLPVEDFQPSTLDDLSKENAAFKEHARVMWVWVGKNGDNNWCVANLRREEKAIPTEAES